MLKTENINCKKLIDMRLGLKELLKGVMECWHLYGTQLNLRFEFYGNDKVCVFEWRSRGYGLLGSLMFVFLAFVGLGKAC